MDELPSAIFGTLAKSHLGPIYPIQIYPTKLVRWYKPSGTGLVDSQARHRRPLPRKVSAAGTAAHPNSATALPCEISCSDSALASLASRRSTHLVPTQAFEGRNYKGPAEGLGVWKKTTSTCTCRLPTRTHFSNCQKDQSFRDLGIGI